jgi:hypothetical protein
MNPDDYFLFGMDPKITTPSDLIINHVIVPPVCIRPTV